MTSILSPGRWVPLAAVTVPGDAPANASTGAPVAATGRRPAARPGPGEVVVLLHGWYANRLVMLRMQWALQRAGYRVINIGYPSVRVPLDRLADDFLPRQLARRLPPEAEIERLHFVTHSMGGLLLRRYLQEHHLPKLGRLVLIGPPNQGSELADFPYLPGVRLVGGPNYPLLGTGPQAIPARLPSAAGIPAEVGVIAGNRSLLHLRRLPQPHDGRVSVAGTRLPGIKDHAVVAATHTWLLWNPQTIALTLRFLRDGSFQPAGAGNSMSQRPIPAVPGDPAKRTPVKTARAGSR